MDNKERIHGCEFYSTFFGGMGFSAVDTSLKLGKSRSFISNQRSLGRTPTLPTAARVLDAIDYDLLIRDRKTGDEIFIIPADF